MKLGLRNNEVIIVPYDKKWKKEFNKTKSEIIQHTNLKPNQIEHIGSTSINEIRAKPIIDILIGVDNLTALDKTFFKALQNAGFYRLKVERSNEIVCAKFTDKTFEIKTHFIHLVELETEKWNLILEGLQYVLKQLQLEMQFQMEKNILIQSLRLDIRMLMKKIES